jgi:hypothetical protein
VRLISSVCEASGDYKENRLGLVGAVKAADPLCLKYPRFKHAEDATAVYMEHA